MILITSRLLRKNIIAIAIFPFIFLKKKTLKSDMILLNHERIHLRQQIELLVIPFYIWYGIEFLIRWIQYKKRRTAYLNISFEREAYQNESNLDYLSNRSFFRFLRYL